MRILHTKPRVACKAPLRICGLILGVVFGLGIWSKSAQAQYATFSFAPPDRLSFQEKHIFKKEILTGLAQPETEIESSETRYDLRKTAQGYAVVATPLQEEPLTESGANLYNALLSRATITYDLDDRGQLTSVRGAQRAYDDLRESLSPEMTDVVFSALGAAGQDPVALVTNLWNGRMILGQYVGRRIKLDTLFKATGDVQLPVGGTARGSIEMFMRSAECPTNQCVQVLISYVSTDQTVADRLGTAMRGLVVGMGHAFLGMLAANEELRRALETEAGVTIDLNTDIDALVPHFQISNARFESENVRLIDTNTGLLHSEGEIQTIKASFGITGQPVTQLVIKQTHLYDYTYPE